MATKTDVADLRSEMAELRSEMTEMRSDMHSLRADVAFDLVSLEKRLSEQIVGLRRAVMESHSSAIGPIPFPDGVLISELDERLRRVEQHLNLAPDAH